MRVRLVVPRLIVSPAEGTTPEPYARCPTTAQGLAQRTRIVSYCATGATRTAVAADLRVTKQTGSTWFVASNVAGLLDEPQPAAPRKRSDQHIERALAATLKSTSPEAGEMAEREGLSRSTVARIWKAFTAQPRRIEAFKLSKDPPFVDQVGDIVGLCLNPRDRVLVQPSASAIRLIEDSRPTILESVA